MKKERQEEILEEQVEETADSNLEAVQEEMASETSEASENADAEASEVIQLQAQLEEKEKKAQEYLSQMQRIQADFANYKKRVEKEKAEIYQFASEKLATDLLETLDNLERALAASKDEKESPLYQGVELTLKHMKEVLKKHGVEEIDALHQPFDMNLHHAVMQEESDHEPNIITEVFQKGYKMYQKTLRPAMVKVSK